MIETLDEASERAPKDLKIEVAPKGKKVEQMVLDGEVDAIIMPNVNQAHAEGDPRIARLWPNYQEVEIDYYRRTGFFPIMHVTTVPTELVAKHPWVVESLTLAFEEAKQLAFQRLANPRNVPLAFCHTYREEEAALFGPDPWEYGLSDLNRRNYDTLVGYVHDQVLDWPAPESRGPLSRAKPSSWSCRSRSCTKSRTIFSPPRRAGPGFAFIAGTRW